MILKELHKQVDENLSSINSDFQTLKFQQKLLSDNAEKIKNNIKEETEKYISLLRGKEKQLLRQVDFVTAHQKSLIDAQIASILLSKGSLLATQNFLAKCGEDDEATLLKIKDSTYVNVKPVTPLRMISVQLDTNPLTNAIEHFGKAHLPDSIMHQHSSVLPAKIEDYGDSDQIALHKSLGGNVSSSGSNSPLKINVRFPKLPNSSWLASSQRKVFNYPKTIAGNKDISSWLADLHMSKDEGSKVATQGKISDDEEDSNSGMDIARVSASHSVMTVPLSKPRCTSSSIEIINSEKDSFCFCEDSSNVAVKIEPAFWKHEIEDILQDSFSFCKDSSNLVRVAPAFCKHEIEDICQANEPCESFEKCLCDGYCKVLAAERAVQTSKWLEKSNFVNFDEAAVPVDCHNVSCRSPQPGQKRKLSAVDSLDQSSKYMVNNLSSDSKGWLLQTADRCCRKGKSPSTRLFVYNPPCDSWLLKKFVTGKNPSLPQTESGRISSMETKKIWLLNQLQNEQKTCDMDKDFEGNGKEEKDIKNTESKQNFVSVEDLKEALVELNEGVRCPPAKKSQSTNIPSLGLIETDVERKLKWLLTSHGQCCPSPDHPSIIVNPVVGTTGSNLDKWLLLKH